MIFILCLFLIIAHQSDVHVLSSHLTIAHKLWQATFSELVVRKNHVFWPTDSLLMNKLSAHSSRNLEQQVNFCTFWQESWYLSGGLSWLQFNVKSDKTARSMIVQMCPFLIWIFWQTKALRSTPGSVAHLWTELPFKDGWLPDAGTIWCRTGFCWIHCPLSHDSGWRN